MHGKWSSTVKMLVSAFIAFSRLYPYDFDPVASLRWVTRGAATEGVTPLFFPEKPGRLFLLIAVTITIAFYCFHSGITPSRVGCHLFTSPVRPRFSTILCKFAHIIFFLQVSPPGGCHPGRSASTMHPLVTPLLWPLTSHLENVFRNARSHDMWQDLLRSLQ